MWWFDTRDMICDAMTKGTLSREPLLALWRTAILTIKGDSPVMWRSSSAPKSAEQSTVAPQSILKANSRVSQQQLIDTTNAIDLDDTTHDHDHLCRFDVTIASRYPTRNTISPYNLPGDNSHVYSSTIVARNHLSLDAASIHYGSTSYVAVRRRLGHSRRHARQHTRDGVCAWETITQLAL